MNRFELVDDQPTRQSPTFGQRFMRGLMIKLACLGLLGALGIGAIGLLSILAALAPEPPPPSPAESAFKAVDSSLPGKRADGGNGQVATALAKAVTDRLRVIERVGFSRDEGEGFRTFRTHCELTEDGVCFLIYTPELKHYKGDVRKKLLEVAWLSARGVAAEVKPPRTMAVALRGRVLYGAMATGRSDGEKPLWSKTNSYVPAGRLFPFFAPATTQTVAAPVKEPR